MTFHDTSDGPRDNPKGWAWYYRLGHWWIGGTPLQFPAEWARWNRRGWWWDRYWLLTLLIVVGAIAAVLFVVFVMWPMLVPAPAPGGTP